MNDLVDLLIKRVDELLWELTKIKRIMIFITILIMGILFLMLLK